MALPGQSAQAVSLLVHERVCWARGLGRVAGLDEAGRGPLAGPVVAGAVVIGQAFLEAEEHGVLLGLTDSKKLTPKRRDSFFEMLTACPEVSIGVGAADVADIDRINILQATHLAMARALAALPVPPEHALVDGLPVPGLPCASTAIVKGDSASLSIAAASIIAKVTRDRQMVELDAQYPAYGFARHKGYGTSAHTQALLEHGPCPLHRRSFRPVRETAAIHAWKHGAT